MGGGRARRWQALLVGEALGVELLWDSKHVAPNCVTVGPIVAVRLVDDAIVVDCPAWSGRLRVTTRGVVGVQDGIEDARRV